jgi:hypothetical protein
MSLRSFPILLLLSASPANAFDTSKLGQGGTLPLADIVALIDTSPTLKREVKQALAQTKKKQDDVVCDGMRFSGQWTHLPGVPVSPYNCDFGTSWLQIQAIVQITDRKGRTFETITPEAMKNATKVSETNLKWKWSTQDPSKLR